MKYVALLRGINVGGKGRVEMAKLKTTFERLGHTGIVTYINSGNIIFTADATPVPQLAQALEFAIETDFGFIVPVVLRTADQIAELCRRIPAAWTNDTVLRTDVIFLRDNLSSAEVAERFAPREFEQALFLEGAFVWHLAREYATRSTLTKIISTD
ncbi:MAG TPA: DUF1697 domain-containing protein, partial [Candidatus Saccharimonadia bacterium]